MVFANTSVFVFSTEPAAGPEIAVMIFVAADATDLMATSWVALVVVPAAAADTASTSADAGAGRNNFQAIAASGAMTGSNRIGAGPMLGR